MAMDTQRALISVLSAALKKTELGAEEREFCAEPERVLQLLRLAKKHDMAHLAALGLSQNGIALSDNAAMLPIKAVYRYETADYELKRMCAALEKAGIAFLPLKGAVIRALYPEPWMRTSSDIDILVHKEDLQGALDCLVKELGYTQKERCAYSYDVELFSPGGVYVELHFSLLGDGPHPEWKRLLDDVWSYTVLKQGHTHWYEMTDEMFYFFHIVHMAKHFEHGGCGVRAIVDQWLLDRVEGVDVAKRDALLEKGGLLKFTQAVRHLSKVWFENGTMDAATEQMHNYILYGGVYGNRENRILLQQQKEGGRTRYIWTKICLPLHMLQKYYPILLKYPWLAPFMQVGRWFRLLFCGLGTRSAAELEYSKSISTEQADEMKNFLNNIGL